jgi:hypothetical protein
MGNGGNGGKFEQEGTEFKCDNFKSRQANLTPAISFFVEPFHGRQTGQSHNPFPGSKEAGALTEKMQR